MVHVAITSDMQLGHDHFVLPVQEQQLPTVDLALVSPGQPVNIFFNNHKIAMQLDALDN